MNPKPNDLENLVISVILFSVVVAISLVLFNVFRRTINGKLRVLMMQLFITKVWTYGASAVYFVLQYNNLMMWLKPQWFRVIAVVPMVWVMLRLYQYIRVDIIKNNNKKLLKTN
jgi:hypothetical protein